MSVATVYADNRQGLSLDVLDTAGPSLVEAHSDPGSNRFNAFAIDHDDNLWIALASPSSAGLLGRIERWDSSGAIVDALDVDFDVEFLAAGAAGILAASVEDQITVFRESNAGDWELSWTIDGLDRIGGVGLHEHRVYALAATYGADGGVGDWSVRVFDEDGELKRDFAVGLPIRNGVECALPIMRVDARGGVAVAFCMRDASGADPADEGPEDKSLNRVHLEKYDVTGELSWHVPSEAVEGTSSNTDICDLAVAADGSVFLTTQESPYGQGPQAATTRRFAP